MQVLLRHSRNPTSARLTTRLHGVWLIAGRCRRVNGKVILPGTGKVNSPPKLTIHSQIQSFCGDGQQRSLPRPRQKLRFE